MKTFILRKKINSSKLEILLPPEFKKWEEIVIKIEKNTRKPTILKFKWIAKDISPNKSYKEIAYEYIKQKYQIFL